MFGSLTFAYISSEWHVIVRDVLRRSSVVFRGRWCTGWRLGRDLLGGHPKPANREREQDIENDGGITSVIVSNVSTEEKKQQVLTLGRLGWSLRRTEKQTGVISLL